MIRESRVTYEKGLSGELYWCNVHQRRADYICHHIYIGGTYACLSYYVCDPRLGGILLPCSTVNLTGQVELVEE